MAKTLGEKLNELLYRHGQMSVAQLVEKGVGVSANTIHRWMSGERVPRAHQVEGVARHFKVPAIYLLDDSIENPEDVGGAATLPEEERAVLELARRMGPANVAWVLRTVELMGIVEASRRLVGVHPGGNHVGTQ